MQTRTEWYVAELRSKLDANIDYYEYALARYMNDVTVDLRARWEVVWRNIGFDIPQDSDLRRSAYTNVIKSVIDSVVSKLYNKKVRSYFTPVNGSFETKQVVNNIQQYFDILFDNQHINRKICEAFKMGCIFGKGYVYCNPITYEITSLSPHLVATLNSESRYEKPKRCLLRYLNFPVDKLKDYDLAVPSDRVTVNFEHYIDVELHKQFFFIDGKDVKHRDYKPSELPLLCLYYNDPVFGENTVGLVQELDGIQTQIDMINSKISASIQLSSTTQTFVLEGSNLTPKDLDSKAGTVYGIKMPPGVNTPPVVSVQQRPFDPMWSDILRLYIEQAYNMAGISELSSQSKKPSGLDSGTSLQTMEDIESDRFETQTTHYIDSFINLTKLLIDVLDEKATILPESINTSSLTWSDVKKQSDLFKIQFSAATMLSKDPAENSKMILQLSQLGQIPVYKLARALNNPDLADVYKDAQAVDDGIAAVIRNAITNEDYDIPDFVSYQGLAQEITVMENELFSNLTGDTKKDKDNEEALSRLYKLESVLLEVMQTNGYVKMDEPEETVSTDQGLGIAPQINKAADITSQLSDGAEVNPNVDEQTEPEVIDGLTNDEI